jgi:hypothetical protein
MASRAPDLVVVTSAYGSEGDILPLLALARECRLAAPARTRVVFVSNPRFEPPEARRDRRLGSLEFVGVGSREAYDTMLADSREPRRRDRRALARFWVSHLDEHFDALRALSAPCARDGKTVVVAHTLDLAARCFEEWVSRSGNEGAVACVTAALSPAMLRCDDVRAPVLSAVVGDCLGQALSRNAPKLAWRVYDAAVDRAMRGVDAFRRRRVFSETQEFSAFPKNALASCEEFKPARGIYRDWFLCRGGVIAMWPPWFGAPHPQWPRRCAQVGFPGELAPRSKAPRSKAAAEEEEDATWAPFLEDARDARRDVWVFMVGSGNPPHARAFFEAAVRAAARARARAVLLTRHADAVPGVSSTPFLHVAPCDLRALLSHDACAGVVHGGGVGTTAVALASGVAQIVVPSGWDQHDNARRAKRLAAKNVVAEISVGAFRASPGRVARLMAETTKESKKRGKVDTFEATRRQSAFVDARSWGGARRAAAHILAPRAWS